MKCADCPYRSRIESKRKADRENKRIKYRMKKNRSKDRALLV